MIVALSVSAGNFENAVEDYEKGAFIKALNAFYVLAKNGDAQAQFNVAMMYENGKGLKANQGEAMYWYEKAAKQDNAAAQYNLAKLYHASAQTDAFAYKKAKYWYEKASKNGMMQAHNNLASLYMEGKGVPKDEKKAFELFEKAANMGDAAAQVNVAVLYAWGSDTVHDKMKAYENLKKALNAGKSEASAYLDRLCEESAWVCKD